MRAVSELGAVIGRSASEEQLLVDASRWLKDSTHADSCEILLPTASGGLNIMASTEHPEIAGRARLARGVGLVGRVYQTGKSIFVADELLEHPIRRELPGLDETGARSAAVIPIPGTEGCAGVVYLTRQNPWAFTSREQAKIEARVRDLSIALAAFRVGRDVGSKVNQMGVINEVTDTIAGSPYLEEVLQLLVGITARRFNYRVVTVRLLDESRQELILRATQATNKAYQKKRAIKLGESIAGRAIASGQPIIVEDVQRSEEYIGHDLAEEQGLHSMVCVPLVVQNRPVGVMSCYTSEVRSFTEDEIAVLETLAKQAALSIEHAKLQVRNTLMQEMHHRVKNNLQQIASLLRLQIRHPHHKSMEDALEDSLNRIQAIAAVHDLLSRDDLDHVSIRHIAEMLGQHQQQSFMLPGKNIRFSFRGDEVHLNTNQATQVALILNEMISNAVEHGFKHTHVGEIHVTVEDKKGEIGLWVANDGDPLPEGFDGETDGQLGLQIIRSLSGALAGKFKIENRLGWTVCEVRFTRQAAE